MVGIFLM